MAQVVFNHLLLETIDPALRPNIESQLSIAANNVRDLINKLDQKYPGLGDRLKRGMSVAIDGEIFNEPLLESLSDDSEVCFISSIEGG
jgi:molybdopterin synthase sulfur carrier subunit